MHIANMFLFLYLICTFASANSKELSKVIEETLKNNHQLKSAKFMRQAVEKSRYQTLSSVLPSASLVMSFDPNKDYTQGSARFQLSQPIFNFGYSYFEWEKTKNTSLVQAANFNLTKQQIIVSAVSSYMKLLEAREVTKLRTSTVSFMERHLEVANKKFQLGEITIGELSQAKSKLSSAIAGLVKASGDENNLVATYTHIIGEYPPATLKYPSTLPAMPENLKEALGKAAKHNNSLKRAYHNNKALEYSSKEAYTKLLPSIGLSASWGYNNFLSSSPQSAPQYTGTSINITVPLFQGGAEYANIASAKYQLYGSAQDYQEATKALEESIISAWNNRESAKSLIKASLDSVASYETTVESVKKEVSLNVKSILNLLDAEINLLTAKISLIDAKSSYIISSYNLMLNANDFNTFFKEG